MDWIYDLVEDSGGTVVESGTSQAPQHQPNDYEDNRVLGEVLATLARVLITSDGDFIAAGSYRGVLIMHPRDFVHRGQIRRIQ